MVKKYRKIFLATLVTLILSYFLFKEIALSDITRAFQDFRLPVLAIILVWFALIFLMDTLRYHLFLYHHPHRSFRRLFSVITGGNLFLNLLPFRSGELSYVIFMNKALNVSKTQGTFIITIMRAFDVIALLTLFAFALFHVENPPGLLHTWFIKWVSLGLFVIAFAALFVMVSQYRFIERLAESILAKFLKRNWMEKIRTVLHAGHQYTQSYGNTYTLLWVGTVSLLHWLLRYLLGFFVVRTLGVPIGLWEMFLISSLLMFSVLIPIQGLADFGVFEAKWTVLFILFGISKEAAITSGLAYHIIMTLFLTVPFGMYGLFHMAVIYKNESDQ